MNITAHLDALFAGILLSVVATYVFGRLRIIVARRVEDHLFRRLEAFQGVSRDVFIYDPQLALRIKRQLDAEKKQRNSDTHSHPHEQAA